MERVGFGNMLTHTCQIQRSKSEQKPPASFEENESYINLKA